MQILGYRIGMILALTLVLAPGIQQEKLVAVDRTPWLEETKCLEMFSAMTQGPDGRIYAGTCNASKLGACLIAFDPKTHHQEKLADMQEVCGEAGSKTLPDRKSVV